MQLSLIDRITNFLTTEDKAETPRIGIERRLQLLKTHANNGLGFLAAIPACFEDVAAYTVALKRDNVVLLNLEGMDPQTKRRLFDYMNGVSYALEANVEKVSENMLIYAPGHVAVNRELYSYSFPLHMKKTV